MRLDVLAVGFAAALVLSQPDLAIPRAAHAQTPPHYQYLSPSPGARLVSRWNNIVIRHGAALDWSTLDSRLLTVAGAQSGVHAGRLTLSDDGRSLMFVPDQPFTLGETVSVRLEQGVKAIGGEVLPAVSFGFSVSGTDPRLQPIPAPEGMLRGTLAAPPIPARATLHGATGMSASQPCDTLPPGSPVITVLDSSDPNPGNLFLAPFISSYGGAYLLIADNRGMPMFYRAIPSAFAAFDFKLQANGHLTYFLGTLNKYYAMDSSFAAVDSFAAGNGYPTDPHDLELLPNGHALLMSYDPEPVDMSAVVPGGNPNASVIGLIIQELDTAKNVIFQWRSWDHFAITDLASPDIALTDSVIDYVHGNAIELDHDGNLLISSRHMNEITKIDRQTGEIIWRLGLHAVNNQFTFVNDSRGFSHQHDIRRLPNGHITLFDNGNFLSPQYSRAVEYDLDEVNKVATLVWEYRDTPDIYGGFMGNVQRHADGTTTIGWGGNFTNPKLTDVHADGSKALEMGIEDNIHTWWSYRTFRFPWKTNRFVTNVDSLEFGSVAVGIPVVRPLSIRNTSGSDVTISCFITTDPTFAVQGTVPITLPPGGSATVDVEYTPADPGEHDATLYVRQVGEDELVAQAVAMRGIANGTTAVTGPGTSRFDLEVSRPNPFSTATAIGFTLPRAGKAKLEIIDVHGRRVETLVNGVRPAGRVEVTWRPRNRANGMYFCRLQAGDRVETRKVMLLK